MILLLKILHWLYAILRRIKFQSAAQPPMCSLICTLAYLSKSTFYCPPPNSAALAPLPHLLLFSLLMDGVLFYLLLLLLFKDFLYFIFRQRGGKGEREGDQHQCMVASSMPPTEAPGLQPRHVS